MICGDDFNRTNLGPNWGVRYGSPGIVDATDVGILSGAFCFIGYTAQDFESDQFSAGSISPRINPRMEKQVFVRRRGADGARYGFHYNIEAARWELKYDGVPTSSVRILASRDDRPAPAPGDVLRVNVVGFAISGYLNDALVLTASDDCSPQKIVSGVPGLAFRPPVGISLSRPAPVFDSWQGGDV